MDAIILDSATPELWERFQRGTRALWGAGQDQLMARWERVRKLGVSPEGDTTPEALLGLSALRERQDERSRLWHVAAPLLHEAASALSARAFRLILADPDGVVLHTLGGGDFEPLAQRARLIEGARWGEAVRGTNAIGTAAQELRPVVVEGAAHYERANHKLVCYAAPLRGPDGALMGVLDATGHVDCANPLVGLSVMSLARLIEQAMWVSQHALLGASARELVERALSHSHQPVLWMTRQGVHQLNDAARRLLGAEARAPWPAGMSWQALEAIVRGGGQGHVRCGEGAPLRVEVEALRDASGAAISLLVCVVGRALEGRSAQAPSAPAPPAHFEQVLGHDPALVAARKLAARVASSALPVLLLAETGTGKGLMARAIHLASGRAARPLVELNCGALTGDLLESELFGYAPGAFTGADRQGRVGKLEQAHGGTLFLDEIAELSPAAQAMLLRVLEDGLYYRVGESAPRQAQVRLIGATCRELPALVEAGTFRADLYYRIRGAVVRLPALRERADLGWLCDALLDALAKELGLATPTLSDEARAALVAHGWPGNVRELRTSLHFALVMAGDEAQVAVHHLPQELSQGAAPAASRPPAAPAASLAQAVERTERQRLREALSVAQGNLSEAARRLGVARSTLYRMLRRHGID